MEAVKISETVGKSYLIKAEDFDRFFEDFKGQEIKSITIGKTK